MTAHSRFTISNVAGGLGDWLSLTPTLRAARDAGLDPLVLAPDSPHTREFATLYQGLSEVQFLPADHADLWPTPETDEATCFSWRILRAHGFRDLWPIPYVEVTEDEREAARRLLGQCIPGCARPERELVAIAPSPGGARSDLPDSHIANYRRWPDELRDRLVERQHSQGLMPVRFGTRATQTHIYQNNREDIPGVLTIPDLNLRQLAACYAVIGRYIGTDTGDHHLMLAVGGTCETWVPPSAWFYDHRKHLYSQEAWLAAGEGIREFYTIYPREMPTAFGTPPADEPFNPLAHEQTK